MFDLDKKQHLDKLKQQAKLVGSRLADQHVSLAVTGLSRSGKTAFITSLVNQLLEARDSAELPFFSVATQGRLYGVRRDSQPDVTLARFTYEEGMARLNQSPPQWPASTNGVSQIRLLIKYQNQSGLRRILSEQSTLTLDITDYPGEWLLDLPLLETSYAQWCEQFWQDLSEPRKAELAQPFLDAVESLELDEPADELRLEHLATKFCEYLHAAKEAGFQLIQPGRFVLPGEMKGAPVLHFFPVSLGEQDPSQAPQGSQLALLQQRFEDYKKHVVKPFYRQHFKRFDRQIVLVDCLSALNQGAHSFADLQKAINWLLSSFHYGRSNVLKRLFSPKIDKLVFAASKADHVTPDQQENLVRLLESMVHEARQQIQFEGVDTESTAFAAIRTSEAAQAELNGESRQVIRGMQQNGKHLLLYPGEVPAQCPDAAFWQSQGFDFPSFLPPTRDTKVALPHMRMDQILEFVLGDKLGGTR